MYLSIEITHVTSTGVYMVVCAAWLSAVGTLGAQIKKYEEEKRLAQDTVSRDEPPTPEASRDPSSGALSEQVLPSPTPA